jgi:hypothetical protein
MAPCVPASGTLLLRLLLHVLVLQLAAALTREEELMPLLIPAAAEHFGPRALICVRR